MWMYMEKLLFCLLFVDVFVDCCDGYFVVCNFFGVWVMCLMVL